MEVCNCSLFCCTLLYVHSSITIILMGMRELIALLNLSSWCLVMVERLFLVVPQGCLQFVIVVFPDHTHLLFFILTVSVRCFLVDHLCYLCLVFDMLSRLFIATLRSPAGKRLTSWLSFVMFNCFCHFPVWYPGSGVVLDCMDSDLCHLSYFKPTIYSCFPIFL